MRIVFVAALLTACSSGGDPAVTPTPTSWSTGVVTETFVDATRPTPANGTAAALPSRTLPTEIWYPSGPGDTGSRARGAPADRAHGPYPLVLFVHGSSGNRLQSTFLTRALAEAGYVVAAADHPLTAISTGGGPSDLHVDDQLDDLRFLADRVAARAADATSPIAGAVRSDQVAVIGHSTGGTVALLAAFAPDRHDDRVRGVVALAPCACFFGDAFFTTRRTPLLVVAGTGDLFVPPSNNGLRAYTLAGAPKAFVSLVGGTHVYFTDFGVPDSTLDPMPTTAHDAIAVALARYGGGTACDPTPAPGTDAMISLARQHDRTVTVTRAFLDDLFGRTHGAVAALAATTDPLLRWQRQP